MAQRPLAAVITLGCKLNLADSEEIARGLRAAGFEVVDRLCEADAYVLNTCSVTHVADQKSRRLIRSARRLAPRAAVTVTGCYPRSAGREAAEALGADLVVGTRDLDKAELVAFLAEQAGGRREEGGVAPPLHPGAGRVRHTRAFVKAQEGCNDVCAFCIVPRTRGRESSRTASEVVLEVSRAVTGGAKEVVITGTHLGAWGRDLDPALTPDRLIAAILESTEVARIRFSSLQPQDITPALLALWQDPRLMPHFHLALQSGSDAVLRAMRRRYGVREFRLGAERIRAAVPDAAITTDVIAGFPGESESDFEETLAFCEEIGFARLHCFPYSMRSRTAAAGMPDQVPHELRRERLARLLALGEELSLRFRRRFAGTVRPVLWEEERAHGEGRLWHGHTDNYVGVYAAGAALQNRITPVTLGEVYHDGVLGCFPGVRV
jgi:threonylcarbamoyladenosine tRNA methylthiotransferase MtaB